MEEFYPTIVAFLPPELDRMEISLISWLVAATDAADEDYLNTTTLLALPPEYADALVSLERRGIISINDSGWELDEFAAMARMQTFKDAGWLEVEQ